MASEKSSERYSRTRRDIKRALLELLGTKSRDEITMSELAREAHVSRSTLYQHYGNVYEAYVDVIRDFDSETAPIMSHAACFEGVEADGAEPFCALLRGDQYRNVINSPCFLETYWGGLDAIGNSELLDALTSSEYSENVAHAIAVFQTAGCFNAVKRYGADDAVWREVRDAIDTFICGGIDACQQKKRHQMNGKRLNAKGN